MSRKFICDEQGNVIDVVEEIGIFDYSPTHDLNWLRTICILRQSSKPFTDYDKGKNEALDFVVELIDRGMTQERKHE